MGNRSLPRERCSDSEVRRASIRQICARRSPENQGYGSGVSDAGDLVASGYDSFYSAWGRSPTLRRIWREHATGADYPEEFAHISFLSLAQLRALAENLNLAADQLLVDLACGAGGPGLWLAKESGARLVGRDLSPVAVERATERATALGMDGRTEFAQGTFEQTGLAAEAADAVMTVDALQYAPDKTKALVEVARILRPGGRFAFVAFELDAERIAELPVWGDPVGDYRPVLEHAGLEILSYEQIPNWRHQVSAGYRAVVAEQEALEAELGEAAAAAMVLEASITLELQPYCGHVFAVAARP
jgi:ubiquinone/menaquinone biosynthesis C-methylase UbiE